MKHTPFSHQTITDFHFLPEWVFYYGAWVFLPSSDATIRSLLKKEKHCLKFKLSELITTQLPLSSGSVLILEDDLTNDDFTSNVHLWLNKVFLPLFQNLIPVICLTDKIGCLKREISFPDPEHIHTEYEKFRDQLAFEQLDQLIQARTVNITWKNHKITLHAPGWIQKKASEMKAIVVKDSNERFNLIKKKRIIPCISVASWPENNGAAYVTEFDCVNRNLFELEPFKKIQLEKILDYSQLAAVTAPPGNVQVLAPAGSGKTRTLIYRILFLIRKGIAPEQILALAFNRKAMVEMQERLAKLGINGVQVYTLHAFGFRILKHFLKAWKLGDETESGQTMRELVAEAIHVQHQPKTFRKQELLNEVVEAVETIKNTLVDPENITLQFEEDQISMGKVFPELIALQKRKKYFGFSDMIYLAVRLLLKQHTFRKQLQQQFKAILVDEFQDLNAAQMLLIDILSRPTRNLFAVGDDDQLIYGWRGARAEFLLNFEKYFGKVQRFILDYNYRCPMDIVVLSRKLVSLNKKRLVKNIYPHHREYQSRVHYVVGKDPWEEAGEMVNCIAKDLEAGISPKNMAVLSRFHAYLFLISLQLHRKGIPHFLPDPSLLFQSVAGKDFLSYLYCSVLPEKAAPWMVQRVLKRPNKFLTNRFIYGVKSLKEVEKKAYREFAAWQWERLAQFLDSFNYLSHLRKGGMSAQGFVNEMVRIFELEFLYTADIQSGVEVEQAGESAILQILMLMSKNFNSPKQFLEYLMQLASEQPLRRKQSHEILLTTIHRTKGNEYPNVFLYHMNNTLDEETEDERRVYYVGLTRAKNKLVVSYTGTQSFQFVKEMVALHGKKNVKNSEQLLNELGQILNESTDVLQSYLPKPENGKKYVGVLTNNQQNFWQNKIFKMQTTENKTMENILFNLNAYAVLKLMEEHKVNGPDSNVPKKSR